MKKTENFKLVEGAFTPSDSINILFALFNSKINFHQLESFRIYEKNSGNVDHHQQRIEELKSSYSEIKKIINEASDAGYNLEIRSTVEVNIISKDL